MASAHIELGSTTRLGGQLRGLHDQIASNITALVNLKAVLDTFAGDYTAMGAALGLTGPDAATQAQTIYAMMGEMGDEFAAAHNTQVFIAVLG